MVDNIILDIDETLIHSSIKKPDKYDFTVTLKITYYVQLRPGLKEFLEYCFAKFKTVSIWTAATKSYAYAIMDKVLTSSQKTQLKFFYTRTELINTSKPLDLIFSQPQAKKLNIYPYNTIIIDDKLQVSRYNLGNSIIVPAWKGQLGDDYLPKLMIILQGIKKMGLVADSVNRRPLFLKQIVG